MRGEIYRYIKMASHYFNISTGHGKIRDKKKIPELRNAGTAFVRVWICPVS